MQIIAKLLSSGNIRQAVPDFFQSSRLVDRLNVIPREFDNQLGQNIQVSVLYRLSA